MIAVPTLEHEVLLVLKVTRGKTILYLKNHERDASLSHRWVHLTEMFSSFRFSFVTRDCLEVIVHNVLPPIQYEKVTYERNCERFEAVRSAITSLMCNTSIRARVYERMEKQREYIEEKGLPIRPTIIATIS